MNKPEYRVRPVTRYVVTMHGEAATSTIGEFTNEFYAGCVAEAMNAHDFTPGAISSAPQSPLADVTTLLRNIAEQIAAGELKGEVGVLTLRAKGQSRPAVFGFGERLNPHDELARAAKELKRLGH